MSTANKGLALTMTGAVLKRGRRGVKVVGLLSDHVGSVALEAGTEEDGSVAGRLGGWKLVTRLCRCQPVNHGEGSGVSICENTSKSLQRLLD